MHILVRFFSMNVAGGKSELRNSEIGDLIEHYHPWNPGLTREQFSRSTRTAASVAGEAANVPETK
jgi:hypothetical protein